MQIISQCVERSKTFQGDNMQVSYLIFNNHPSSTASPTNAQIKYKNLTYIIIMPTIELISLYYCMMNWRGAPSSKPSSLLHLTLDCLRYKLADLIRANRSLDLM